MLITATGTLQAGWDGSILYRGEYKDILPLIREDGFEAVELHILDSREIDREALWRLLWRFLTRILKRYRISKPPFRRL